MRLSPPELSYLHASLTATPPLRPDLRALTAYRPRSLQKDFLATANGSARITWAGGDVLVVVKAQIGEAVQLAPGIPGGQVFVDVYLPAPLLRRGTNLGQGMGMTTRVRFLSRPW